MEGRQVYVSEPTKGVLALGIQTSIYIPTSSSTVRDPRAVFRKDPTRAPKGSRRDREGLVESSTGVRGWIIESSTRRPSPRRRSGELYRLVSRCRLRLLTPCGSVKPIKGAPPPLTRQSCKRYDPMPTTKSVFILHVNLPQVCQSSQRGARSSI